MPRTDATWERVTPSSRADWRGWLAGHHASSPGIWLVYWKKGSGQPTLSYDDAVEEALCFGWIDSRVNALDAGRYQQIFTPRKPTSAWSRLNKERVARLLAAGLIAPPGLAVIEAAQRNGAWSALDAVEALEVPPDLAAALAADPLAEASFHAFSPSQRKQWLYRLAKAKRPETRARRLAQIVAVVAEKAGSRDATTRPRR
jgi:uncharacterized protein YdeI (YjbR/CyaY-like superfamily)